MTTIADPRDFDPVDAQQLLTQVGPLIGAFAKGINKELLLVDPNDQARQRPNIVLLYMADFTRDNVLNHSQNLKRISSEDAQLHVGDKCFAFTYATASIKRLVMIYVAKASAAADRVSCVGEALLRLLEVDSKISSAHWATWAAGGGRSPPDQTVLSAFEGAVRERATGGTFDLSGRFGRALPAAPGSR
jgi:hypothetical protein